MYKRMACCISFAFFSLSGHSDFYYVDFDESMHISMYDLDKLKPPSDNLYAYFKNLYEKNSKNTIIQSSSPKIPKIIHQIWLGSEFPERFKHWQKTWTLYHPDWQYKLWTDKDVDKFPFKNKTLFKQTRNYGQKADIWRYEILEKFGGVYIDVDFECLKSLDNLHYLYDFYVGLPMVGAYGVQVGIGIIGARPHHPIVKAAVFLLAKRPKRGPIVKKTGPIFFTNICKYFVGKTTYTDSVLPASYFYPRAYEQPENPRSAWLHPESFAVHHWAGSWLIKPSVLWRK